MIITKYYREKWPLRGHIAETLTEVNRLNCIRCADLWKAVLVNLFIYELLFLCLFITRIYRTIPNGSRLSSQPIQNAAAFFQINIFIEMVEFRYHYESIGKANRRPDRMIFYRGGMAIRDKWVNIIGEPPLPIKDEINFCGEMRKVTSRSEEIIRIIAWYVIDKS